MYLNPYLNFHRPCGFAEVKVNERGKRRRRYPVDQYRTPYEKLQMLPDWQKCLKKGLSAERLAQRASAMTDTERCPADAAGSGPVAGTEPSPVKRAREHCTTDAKGRALNRRPLLLHSHPRLCAKPERKEA
jgi:hypothetical protein